MRIVTGLMHQMRNGRRIVGCGRGCERQRERYHFAALHQARGGCALFVSDKIQRPAFVVFTPAALVVELVK